MALNLHNTTTDVLCILRGVTPSDVFLNCPTTLIHTCFPFLVVHFYTQQLRINLTAFELNSAI